MSRTENVELTTLCLVYRPGANVKKKVGQCLKKIRPPALEKNYTTW